MSSREDTPEPGTSAASTSQAAPAAPQDDHQENAVCPECRDISTVCSSSCRHCFCQLCLWDWSLGEAVCPRCQRPIRHPYPQHVALYHEVQDRVYDNKRRWRGHSARQPRSCSGHFGHRRPWERRPRRSIRWPRNGRWRSQHSRGSDSPRRSLLTAKSVLAQVPQVMEPSGTVTGPPQVEQGQGAFPWLGQVAEQVLVEWHPDRLPPPLRKAEALEELGW
ncbi:uncharacterized protein FYW23_004858 [Sylvia borin]